MALHVSGKLSVVAVVLIVLITAFNAPNLFDLSLTPVVSVREGIDVTPEIVVAKTQPKIAEDAPLAGPEAGFSAVVKATGYNSLAAQTDDSPHITAIGSRTRFGIIAVSRDLLGQDVPYGSLVRIKDLGNYYNGRGYGKYQTMLDRQGFFVVEDTMHIRKQDQVDVWFPHMSEALNWGVRQVEIEVVRYGWDGPEFLAQTGAISEFSLR